METYPSSPLRPYYEIRTPSDTTIHAVDPALEVWEITGHHFNPQTGMTRALLTYVCEPCPRDYDDLLWDAAIQLENGWTAVEAEIQHPVSAKTLAIRWRLENGMRVPVEQEKPTRAQLEAWDRDRVEYPF